MKDTKIPKNSTDDKNKQKRKSPGADPHHMLSWRKIPISPAMIDRLTEELPDWPLKNPMAKTITEFYLGNGLSQSNYYALLERHPKMKEAHGIAMHRLGDRLWGRAVDKAADWSAVKHMLHSYNERYAQADSYHAKLKLETEKQDVEQQNTKFIVIPQVVYRDKPDTTKTSD